jgi:hypothetical protein
MSEPLYCPYCNTAVTPPTAVRAGQQVSCPRCEESFKVLANGDLPPATTSTAEYAAPPVAGPRRSNAAVAGVVLGVMGFMAAAGLTLALLTQQKRREHDRRLPRPQAQKRPRQQDVATPPPPRTPLDLDALHYLPPDSDLVLGADVAALRADKGVQKLLQADLAGLGSVEGRLLGRVRQLTGLDPKDLDHVAVGARLGGSEQGRVVVVLRTRKEYDADKIVKNLEARPHPRDREHLFMFRRELLPTHTDGLLTFPDDRTVALGWWAQPADIPMKRREGAVRLPGALLTLLTGPHKPRGPLWAVGHNDGWDRPLSLLLAFARVPEEQRKLVVKVRSFSAGVELLGSPVVRADLHFADEDSTRNAEQLLRERFKGQKGFKAEGGEGWLLLQYRPEG